MAERKEKTFTVNDLLTRSDIKEVLDHTREIAREATGIIVIVTNGDRYESLTNLSRGDVVLFLETLKAEIIGG